MILSLASSAQQSPSDFFLFIFAGLALHSAMDRDGLGFKAVRAGSGTGVVNLSSYLLLFNVSG